MNVIELLDPDKFIGTDWAVWHGVRGYDAIEVERTRYDDYVISLYEKAGYKIRRHTIQIPLEELEIYFDTEFNYRDTSYLAVKKHAVVYAEESVRYAKIPGLVDSMP